MLPQFTSFANTPCSCSVFTNFVIDSAGPDSVQKLGPLWHATTISGGHSFPACSAPRPARHQSFVTCATSIRSTSSLSNSQRQILVLLCHFLAYHIFHQNFMCVFVSSTQATYAYNHNC